MASTPEGPPEPLVLRAVSLIISPLICWYAESGISSTGPNNSAPKLAFCASGCFSLSCRITSSVSGKTPPLSASLRKRRAELICPSITSLAKILALFGGSLFLRDFCIRRWIMRPSRNKHSISPFFHGFNRFSIHSWWSLAFDFWLGFWSPTAKRTMVAFRARYCMIVPLFQSR